MVLFLACVGAAAAQAPANASVTAGTSTLTGVNDPEYTIDVAGTKRRYQAHRPLTQPLNVLLPVVLVFHDNLSNVDEVRKQSGWSALADQKGFMVVYPEGSGHFASFNAGHCCGYALVQQVDDVAFIHLLIDNLAKRYAVDPGRIYAAGIGNGGMMAYRLAYEMYEKIAAAGSVAGDLEAIGSESPKRPVPIIHFHGMKDEKVPYNGGSAKGSIGSAADHASVAQTIGYWIHSNKCQGVPVEVKTEKDSTMTRYEPETGIPGAPVVLYTLPEGGHTWPGGVQTGGYLGNETLIHSVDATAIMWDFFDEFNIGGVRKKE
jgi:polyhydroxybutyrate depolymerase